MKKKILIGCFLSFFILMTAPSIPALKLETLKKNIESKLPDELQDMDIEELIEEFKNRLPQDTKDLSFTGYILILLLLLYSLEIQRENPLLSLICLLTALNIILYNL